MYNLIDNELENTIVLIDAMNKLKHVIGIHNIEETSHIISNSIID